MELAMGNGFSTVGFTELNEQEKLWIGGGEWSWSDFGKSVFSNAMGGCASGFVYGALGGTVIMPGVGTIAGLPVAGVGLVGGAAWGAVSYAAGQLWDGLTGN